MKLGVPVLFLLATLSFPAEISSANGSDDNTVSTAAVPFSSSSPSLISTKKGWTCPPTEPFEWFPLPCSSNKDCKLMGRGYLCCGSKTKHCTKGLRKETSDEISIRSIAPTVNNIIIAPSKPSTTVITITASTIDVPKPTKSPKIKSKPIVKAKAEDLVCPKPSDVPFQFIYVRCVRKHSECKKSLGPNFVCCNKRCVRGTAPPIEEQSHQSIFGLIPQECPSQPFGELLFETQACETDAECWPRVCCPDGQKRYCRTAMPRLDLVPATKNFNTPLSMVADYLQCSNPPPRNLDLFPKQCTTSLDCFPNLCCQEEGNRHCRPARRSLLALLAGATQNIGSSFAGIGQNQVGKRET